VRVRVVRAHALWLGTETAHVVRFCVRDPTHHLKSHQCREEEQEHRPGGSEGSSHEFSPERSAANSA